MSCIYLVIFNESKKVLHCEKCELYKKIGNIYNIKKEFLLYQWNSEFEEWIDVDDPKDLPDKTKLFIKLKGN